MRPIDADVLEKELAHECVSLRGDNTRKTFYRAIKIVRQQPTVTTPPNDPLTLEELREMDGDPVWIEQNEGGPSRWAIVTDFESSYHVYFGTVRGRLCLPCDDYGKTWLAYRRKPEEETT